MFAVKSVIIHTSYAVQQCLNAALVPYKQTPTQGQAISPAHSQVLLRVLCPHHAFAPAIFVRSQHVLLDKRLCEVHHCARDRSAEGQEPTDGPPVAAYRENRMQLAAVI
jgi:hypothetical protein